jgi:hypothetical protein
MGYAVRVIRLTITKAAYNAIIATLPIGTVALEPKLDRRGGYLVWVERQWADKLDAMRRPGESYSDVILRLAAAKGGT